VLAGKEDQSDGLDNGRQFDRDEGSKTASSKSNYCTVSRRYMHRVEESYSARQANNQQ
jgi:hypothetical protein